MNFLNFCDTVNDFNKMIDLKRLSYEEKKAIEDLRMRVETAMGPDMLEDFSLFYRFLKARDFDVDKAEKMLRKNISWRKAHQMNTILQDFQPREFYVKYIDPIYLGRDKEGDLVSYTPIGKHDGKDILKCTMMNEYVKHWMWYAERSKAALKQLASKGEKTLPQVSCIVNLDKLTIVNATNKSSSEICVRVINILLENYPEGIKSVYVINAPVYYVFIFSILKTMMSNALIQKIFVFSHNGWKEKLLENIDEEILPAFLGGNETDVDCSSLSRLKTVEAWGGKIPSHHYLPNEDRYFKNKTEVTKISVPQHGKKEVYIHVKERESVIRWEFLVKNKDIGFGLCLEELEEVMELLPVQRYDTIDGVETGSYRAKSPGKYVIIFDNSYSWLNSKEIEYCVKVVKP